ncbi:MAG: acyl-CoA dehydrogenase, partial [Comamonas sp.]
FTEGGAPSHDALKTALPYMVDEQGQVNDPALRDKLASVLMDAQAFGLTHRRVKEKALASKYISCPSSIMKMVHNEQEVS